MTIFDPFGTETVYAAAAYYNPEDCPDDFPPPDWDLPSDV